ncbi:MAG: hypothetical protein OXC27_15305 [Caldilineaceae bacterium]|nr:hypothetical protein [Caldilineaceae bacterium]
MIALRTRSATLAIGGTCQLHQCAVKFFDPPTQRVGVLRELREGGLIWVIGDSPVKIGSVFRATTLNKLTLKGTFLSLTVML